MTLTALADAPIVRDALVAPHGGVLKDLYLPPEQALAARRRSGELPSLTLGERQSCDLELLLSGAFSPLEGFLGRDDYNRVLEEMRLADGTLWPMPITLDVSEAFSASLSRGSEVVLRDGQGVPLAVLEVGDIYWPEHLYEARRVFGSSDRAHPGVAELLDNTGPVYLGGRVRGLQPPAHYDFPELRDTPRGLREWFAAHGWSRIVAFQTRNPMHRAHRELTLRAARQTGAKLLIQPTVGRTRPGDVDHATRVRCYRALMPQYPEGSARLSLLPLAMRMGGPREALWHAIVRKNYGASHFIVGRDHAGPGKDSKGEPFYGPCEAQQLLERHQAELGVEIVAFPTMVYVAGRDAYVPTTELAAGDVARDLSGTELRRRLREGADIPPWFSFPEVVRILRERYPAHAPRGFAVFLTGFSGAGKSALAQAVAARLLERTGRPVTVLDGDQARRQLSPGLGYSREDRDAHVARIGYVAGEVVRHGGIAVCAAIAPYAAARAQVRALVEAHGAFVEVHVATALAVCEACDGKGLYAQARAGRLARFTGIGDPYEVPANPELRVDGGAAEPVALAAQVMALLREKGLLGK